MNDDNETASAVPEGVTRRAFVAGGGAAGGTLTLAQSSVQAQPRESGSGAFWPEDVRLPITISMMWEAGSEPMP